LINEWMLRELREREKEKERELRERENREAPYLTAGLYIMVMQRN